ncbi:TetR/AcrR family transcriptional regulator [Oceanicoccus sp. KOV_DT_Chl]|uniref:TetR/AcrR family transcriptional regulator n=1 Tax=Oceanicoccus sp. KOV_DT_Chl TaxID=1904639 RepID=UPI000C7D61C8|nr:TetR/AcrR family transcriptional regulator [Oceanicoccus sp. KOV_DT_Chl]
MTIQVYQQPSLPIHNNSSQTLDMHNASREQQKLLTQNKILAAAIAVFAETGFDAASLGAIAKLSGVKKALVQYHFETKEKLWQAAIDQLWGQLRETLPVYIDQADTTAYGTEQSMRLIFKQIIRFAKDHPAWVGIMFREASTPGPRLEWMVEKYLHKDFNDGTRFIEFAQQQGLLPQASALHLLHIISGALTYALFVAPLTEKVTGVDMTTEQSLDTLVDTLMLLLHNQQIAIN